MRLVGLLLGAVLATGMGAAADPLPDSPSIGRARHALEQAAGALDEAQGGRASLVALGRAVAAHEVALAAYREGLRAMAAREAMLRGDLERDGERLEQLLVALQALGEAPRSALFAVPGGPSGAARGAMLMEAVTPELEARVVELNERLDGMARLRAEQEAARTEARATLAALQELRADTDEALRERRARDLPGRDALRAQAEAAARQAPRPRRAGGGAGARGRRRDGSARLRSPRRAGWCPRPCRA